MANSNAGMPLYEQIVKELEGQIVSGTYKRGDLLPSENELTEQYGVSRITVRKALSILSNMGIIETSKGRGSTVLFSIEDKEDHRRFSEEVEEYKRVFRESTQIRLMLEPEIARQVAECATREQKEYIKDCVSGKNEEVDKHDFHRLIVSTLGNKELSDIMEKLISLEESKAPAGVIPPEGQEKVGKLLKQQHKKILDAIQRGDGEFAYFYMKEHTRYVAQMYDEYFDHLY